MRQVVVISRSCLRCKEQHNIEMAEADYDSWQLGEHIQSAAPYLSEDDRELLISGICGPCFDAIFTEEDEDE